MITQSQTTDSVASYAPQIRRLKGSGSVALRELRILTHRGILAGLREPLGVNEPSSLELAELLDPLSTRLVATAEFSGLREELMSRVAAATLRSVGLVTRRTSPSTSTAAELREFATQVRWRGPIPRTGATSREVVVSFRREPVDEWFRLKLTTTDYPDNPHPVVSGLYLGHSLWDVLTYYRQQDFPIPASLLRRELACYRASIRRLSRRILTRA